MWYKWLTCAPRAPFSFSDESKHSEFSGSMGKILQILPKYLLVKYLSSWAFRMFLTKAGPMDKPIITVIQETEARRITS